ncbi:MAG TPA: shikimate kinase [Streptosporangiaceae bacterium]|nr:shikimate kinase [Streptosporangiaceae bacterium]
MTGPVLILIGPPGAGKSTVGALVAGQLGVSFADTDADIEKTAGKPVSDIFIEDGEQAFRDLEREAVRQALTSAEGVLAVGGGAVLDKETQESIKDRPVVYLETGFAEAAKRTGLSQARPLLIGTNPRATLKALLDARLPIYERLARMIVQTDGRAPEEIADEVVRRLKDQP